MRLYIIFCILIFTSCKDNKEKFSYETSIASKTHEAQMKYLNNTLFNYSRMTEQGNLFHKQCLALDSLAKKLKMQLELGREIQKSEQKRLFEPFDKHFEANELIDLDVYKETRDLPIRSKSDIDIISAYIKNNLVCILLNNKLLPYNSWGTLAAAESWTIKEGEEFVVQLANTAWNSSNPHEWYVTDVGESNKTIVDTLYPDDLGTVTYKTRKYKKGQNELRFTSKLKTPGEERSLSRTVSFTVK